MYNFQIAITYSIAPCQIDSTFDLYDISEILFAIQIYRMKLRIRYRYH